MVRDFCWLKVQSTVQNSLWQAALHSQKTWLIILELNSLICCAESSYATFFTVPGPISLMYEKPLLASNHQISSWALMSKFYVSKTQLSFFTLRHPPLSAMLISKLNNKILGTRSLCTITIPVTWYLSPYCLLETDEGELERELWIKALSPPRPTNACFDI